MTIKEIIQFEFGEDEFTLNEAYNAVESRINVKRPSIRARIYEAVDKGVLARISKGVFMSNDCLLIQGDGRDLSFLPNESIDAIVTDHPYDIKKSNVGGSRNFATYNCFQYTQNDFYEKARVLKTGCFLVEFIPEENGDNWEYLSKIKEMAKKAGLNYYAKVPWIKTGFVSNCGRKSKNTEEVLIFSKGKARELRPDAKKDKTEPGVLHFMSGANGMLPTAFNFPKPIKMEHQAEKPLELLISIINYITIPGELILDQFAGSGVTGEAAIQTDRKSILIEIEEEYINKIQNRLNLKSYSYS